MNSPDKVFLAVICAILFSCCVASEVLTYELQHFSPRAHELLEDGGESALYKVHLMHVHEHFPNALTIHQLHLRLTSKRLIPGLSYKRYFRRRMLSKDALLMKTDEKLFFGSFREGTPYTYVMLDDKLIFTESTKNPEQEKYKDKLSKHFFISGFKKRLYYSGEFRVYKNKKRQEVFVVFDNKSGTYRPPEPLLPRLKELLNKNFKAPGLYFLTKSRDQEVDRKALFKHKEVVSRF